ncbi:hypothetical protein ABZ626_24300 [Streptomyces longispororuber]|uniref:hypothetical protein n=1 Tax=Streptomyces longispororuber TaxID=68230 RepID=UPI0033EB7185
MSHTVLAVGAAVVTASGCVWYLPALADLRAGADRPVSRRTAAAACLSGWTTIASAAVLLLVAEAWWLPCAAVVAGAAVTVALRVCAGVRRRREQREAAYQWTRLRDGAPPPAETGDARHVVAVLVGTGLVAAVTTAGLKVAAGPGGGADWPRAAAASAAVLGLFLAVAFAHGRRVRRRARARLPHEDPPA